VIVWLKRHMQCVGNQFSEVCSILARCRGLAHR
jgi:hypothetical protein